KYSKEEGTPSAKFTGQITERTKNRRLDEIMRRQADISLEKNKEMVGRRCEAIVDEIDGDAIIARLYSHAPEIDGVVIIDNRLQETSDIKTSGAPKVGDIVTVEITDAFDYDLKGKL
ncbi:MAG: TRAM domain-containing protein, partial [Nitrospirae bacterium]|nr:TRAM domain-containing protein [Nitrospirota bacterium]